jgi:hypothetical protein
MAIGRISGPMLFNNLERQGVDLAFQGNLLYLDVNNLRVGVLNSAPNYVLDSSGNVKLANVIIEGNTIASNTGVINFGNVSNITISGGAPNAVLYTDGNGNLNWGEISSLDTTFDNFVVNNFSTANAVITGGYIQNVANLTTSGAIVSNGNIVAASGVNATNYTTGALVVPGGGGVGITGDLWVQGPSTFAGNIVAGNIQLSGNINVPVGGTFSNTGVFFGNAGGIGALYAGTTTYTALPTTVFQMTGNVDTYAQVNFQNLNSGTNASTDFVLTADNGTDTDGYINLGIDSSNYNNPGFPGFYPNDGYLIHHTAAGSGNLVIFSHESGSAIKLHVGEYGDANVRATVTNSGFVVNTATTSTSISSGALIVNGGLGVSGNIHAAAVNNTPIGNAVPSTGSFTDVDANNLVVSNFSTSNAVVTGGYLTGLSNINAVTGNVESWYATILNSSSGNIFGPLFATSFSTANAQVTGGQIANVDAQVNNLSSANVLLSGGILYNVDIQANNLSTANALIAGGILYNVDIQANNFSTANVLVSGGVLYNVDLQANNFSTANVLVSGGVLYNVDLQANNFSTANALINGGDISNVNAQINNFSTANALVSGGVLYNVDLQANNFSTANALIAGGVIYNVDIQANNFSTANALITGGNVTANITGNVNGSFADFSGNVYGDWFVGNVDSQFGNFSDAVFANSNLTVSGNLIAAGNILTQKITATNGDLHISADPSDPNNVVVFDSISAFAIPTGNTVQRPGSPDEGYVRFNTDVGAIEWWTGLSWTSSNQGVNYQTIVPDGVSNSYTLDQESSDAGILVSINGTTQQPGTSYNITGGTTITFSEVPLTTDIIEIRFLSAGLVAANYTGGNVSGNVNILATTTSNSTTTGALTVSGGAGIAGNINIGGNLSVSSTTGTPSNTASPANWLKIHVGGATYYIPLYQ